MSTALQARDEDGRGSAASWWRGRYGLRLLVEIAICGGLLVTYRSIRLVNRTDLRTAFANARDVVRVEQWLGIPFESDLQRFLLDHPSLIKLLNHYYVAFHFPAAIALLLWLYLRHHDRYGAIRNLMAFVTFAALIIHLLFPLAPPRMMSGFVDTMREFGPSIYPPDVGDGAANQIAAMPSLHFGWAMIEAMAVVAVLTSVWRWLIVIHPTLMTLAIVATANHWWLDAAAAAMLIIGAVAVWRLGVRWAGDRRWSWTRMRFQPAEAIARLETLANTQPDRESTGGELDRVEPATSAIQVAGSAFGGSAIGGSAIGGPANVSTVANDDTDERANFVG